MANETWFTKIKLQIIRAKEIWVLFTHSMPKFVKDFIPVVAHWIAPIAVFLEFAELHVVNEDIKLLLEEQKTKPSKELANKIYNANVDLFFQAMRTFLRCVAATFIMVVGFAAVAASIVVASQALAVIATGWSAIDYCFKGYRAYNFEKDNPKRADWDRLLFKGVMLFATAAGLALMFFCPPLAVVGWGIAFSASSSILARGMWAHNNVGKVFAGLTTTSIVMSCLVLAGVLAVPGLNIVVAAAIVVGLSIAGMLYVMSTKSDKSKLAAKPAETQTQNVSDDTIDLKGQHNAKPRPMYNFDMHPIQFMRSVYNSKTPTLVTVAAAADETTPTHVEKKGRSCFRLFN